MARVQESMPQKTEVYNGVSRLSNAWINKIQDMEFEGYKSTEIAERLGLALSTVRKYMKTPPLARPRITIPMRRKILKMRADGSLIREIAEEVGISKTAVKRVLSDPDAKSRRVSIRKIREIRDLRREGRSTIEIAKTVGVSKNSVLRYGGFQYGGANNRWTAHELKQQVAALEDEGIMSRKEQAERIGCHYHTLLKHVGGQEPAWNPTLAEIKQIRERWMAGETGRNIAKEYPVDENTIYNLLNRQGRWKYT